MSTQQDHIVQPQPADTATRRRRLTVGFPSSADSGELRFPITPEGVAQLSALGLTVYVETGAGSPIHYSDARYAEAGAVVGKRAESLAADIVVSLAPLSVADTSLLRKGAMLMSLLGQGALSAEFVRCLLLRHVTYVALEKILSGQNQRPFADILLETDGRVAMAVASAVLLRPEFGKGILLGGVTGVIPCEVVVIGSGIGARAAAASAIGMGAQVKILDNDIYGLRAATLSLGTAVATSVLQPHVVDNALRSADVVIASPAAGFSGFTSAQLGNAKKGVVLIDLSPLSVSMFPTEKQVPITYAQPRQNPGGRVCFRSIGNAAPRTAAMALSNTILSLFSKLSSLDGVLSLVRADAGLQAAVCTFMGKAVSSDFAALAGVRPLDLNLLLSCS